MHVRIYLHYTLPLHVLHTKLMDSFTSSTPIQLRCFPSSSSSILFILLQSQSLIYYWIIIADDDGGVLWTRSLFCARWSQFITNNTCHPSYVQSSCRDMNGPEVGGTEEDGNNRFIWEWDEDGVKIVPFMLVCTSSRCFFGIQFNIKYI